MRDTDPFIPRLRISMVSSHWHVLLPIRLQKEMDPEMLSERMNREPALKKKHEKIRIIWEIISSLERLFNQRILIQIIYYTKFL